MNTPAGPPGPTGPGLQSSPQIYGSTEEFAEEPQGWSQVHKVLTRDLTRLQKQVMRLKHRAWPGALSFSLSASALSLAINGGSRVADYYTTTPRPSDAPSGSAWIMLGGGVGVAVLGAALGLVFRHHCRSDVEDVVTEIGTLTYSGESEE